MKKARLVCYSYTSEDKGLIAVKIRDIPRKFRWVLYLISESLVCSEKQQIAQRYPLPFLDESDSGNLPRFSCITLFLKIMIFRTEICASTTKRIVLATNQNPWRTPLEASN